jgi:uncharacterized protein YciI
MEFDQLGVALLTTRDGSRERPDPEEDAVQDAHMAHLADLHDAGQLLAAGPLMNEHFRGLLLFTVDAQSVTDLMLADPALRAGRFDLTVIPWMVPTGALRFFSTRFPRSMAEIN